MKLTAILLSLLLLAAGSATATPKYPLKLSDDKRFLVDAADMPYFFHADTAWHLLWKLDKAEAYDFFHSRMAQRFTAIQVMLAAEGMDAQAVNRDGEPLFLAPWDITKPNEKFFVHVDAVLKSALSQNMLIVMNPAWLGCCEGGWRDHLRTHGPEKCRAYGEWLGKRLAAHQNLMWLNGGDRDPGEYTECVRAIAEGIRSAAPHQLQTAHAASTHSAMDVYAKEPWLDLNTTYTYDPAHQGAWTKQFQVYRNCRVDFLREPRKPFFLVESCYEGEHEAPPSKIRRQAWWAMLSGACGQAYGHGAIWKFSKGWEEEMDAKGARHLFHLAGFLRNKPWFELVPDHAHKYVTDGLGTYNDGSTPGGDDFVTAAATADGKLLVAYVPSPRTLKITVSGRLRWFDPTNGNHAPVDGVTEFSSPERNSEGDGDWVLVVDQPDDL